MKKKTVALLSGGISSERQVSLNSGDQVYEALEQAKYDILRYDPATDIERLVADAAKIDVALIILHGPYGEDGTIQGLLDLLDIPYQGSGVLGSALAMNKLVSKQLYEKAAIPIPPYLVINSKNDINLQNMSARLGWPVVVKPVEAGSSIGMSIVKKEDELAQALEDGFKQDNCLLLESYIDGIELTGGVIGNESLEALPLIEIIPDESHPFFDYEAKYTAGATNEICPARISDTLTKEAQRLAKAAHTALFCTGYSRTDMILKDDQIFVLETNTIPGMTPTSLFPQAAQKAGLSFSRLLDRLIELGISAHHRQKISR
jgi:D-alanine-D-alanine ligase